MDLRYRPHKAYQLSKGGEKKVFSTPQDAAAFLGAKPYRIAQVAAKKTDRTLDGWLITELGDLNADLRIKRLMNIWRMMINRCEKATNKRYSNYGGRGIKVCPEWHDYYTFAKWALANGYDDCLTIDRADNDGNYEPGNCRWATLKEQANNRQSSRKITYKGETKTVAEWAEHYGIIKSTMYDRVHRYGEQYAMIIADEKSGNT